MHAPRDYAAPSPQVRSVSHDCLGKRNLQLKKQVREEIYCIFEEIEI